MLKSSFFFSTIIPSPSLPAGQRGRQDELLSWADSDLIIGGDRLCKLYKKAKRDEADTTSAVVFVDVCYLNQTLIVVTEQAVLGFDMENGRMRKFTPAATIFKEADELEQILSGGGATSVAGGRTPLTPGEGRDRGGEARAKGEKGSKGEGGKEDESDEEEWRPLPEVKFGKTVTEDSKFTMRYLQRCESRRIKEREFLEKEEFLNRGGAKRAAAKKGMSQTYSEGFFKGSAASSFGGNGGNGNGGTKMERGSLGLGGAESDSPVTSPESSPKGKGGATFSDDEIEPMSPPGGAGGLNPAEAEQDKKHLKEGNFASETLSSACFDGDQARLILGTDRGRLLLVDTKRFAPVCGPLRTSHQNERASTQMVYIPKTTGPLGYYRYYDHFLRRKELMGLERSGGLAAENKSSSGGGPPPHPAGVVSTSADGAKDQGLAEQGADVAKGFSKSAHTKTPDGSRDGESAAESLEKAPAAAKAAASAGQTQSKHSLHLPFGLICSGGNDGQIILLEDNPIRNYPLLKTVLFSPTCWQLKNLYFDFIEGLLVSTTDIQICFWSLAANMKTAQKRINIVAQDKSAKVAQDKSAAMVKQLDRLNAISDEQMAASKSPDAPKKDGKTGIMATKTGAKPSRRVSKNVLVAEKERGAEEDGGVASGTEGGPAPKTSQQPAGAGGGEAGAPPEVDLSGIDLRQNSAMLRWENTHLSLSLQASTGSLVVTNMLTGMVEDIFRHVRGVAHGKDVVDIDWFATAVAICSDVPERIAGVPDIHDAGVPVVWAGKRVGFDNEPSLQEKIKKAVAKASAEAPLPPGAAPAAAAVKKKTEESKPVVDMMKAGTGEQEPPPSRSRSVFGLHHFPFFQEFMEILRAAMRHDGLCDLPDGVQDRIALLKRYALWEAEKLGEGKRLETAQAMSKLPGGEAAGLLFGVGDVLREVPPLPQEMTYARSGSGITGVSQSSGGGHGAAGKTFLTQNGAASAASGDGGEKGESGGSGQHAGFTDHLTSFLQSGSALPPDSAKATVAKPVMPTGMLQRVIPPEDLPEGFPRPLKVSRKQFENLRQALIQWADALVQNPNIEPQERPEREAALDIHAELNCLEALEWRQVQKFLEEDPEILHIFCNILGRLDQQFYAEEEDVEAGGTTSSDPFAPGAADQDATKKSASMLGPSTVTTEEESEIRSSNSAEAASAEVVPKRHARNLKQRELAWQAELKATSNGHVIGEGPESCVVVVGSKVGELSVLRMTVRRVKEESFGSGSGFRRGSKQEGTLDMISPSRGTTSTALESPPPSSGAASRGSKKPERTPSYVAQRRPSNGSLSGSDGGGVTSSGRRRGSIDLRSGMRRGSIGSLNSRSLRFQRETICTWHAHEGAVKFIKVLPGTKTIISVGEHGDVKFWPLDLKYGSDGRDPEDANAGVTFFWVDMPRVQAVVPSDQPPALRPMDSATTLDSGTGTNQGGGGGQVDEIMGRTRIRVMVRTDQCLFKKPWAQLSLPQKTSQGPWFLPDCILGRELVYRVSDRFRTGFRPMSHVGFAESMSQCE